jgi:hypothetical protein
LNLNRIESFPNETFYLPFTRFWELLVGSLLAYGEKNNFLLRNKVFSHQFTHNIFSILGLFLIGFASFKLTRKGFPGIWALYPVLGSALLILAGKSIFNRFILSQKWIVYFGLISYPLYLWHWPLLSFAHIIETEIPNQRIRIEALILSFTLAILTFELIEKKIRFNTSFAKKLSQRHLAIALVTIVITLGCVSLLNFFDLIGHKLNRFAFTPAQFSYEKICKEYFPFAKNSYCGLSNDNPHPEIVLIGDSHALHYFPALKKYYFEKQQKSIFLLGQGGCLAFNEVDRLVDNIGERMNC